MVIRPETPDDAPAIYDLHAAGFPTPAEARLVERLRASGRLSVSLVAEHLGRVVGHVAFSPVSTARGAVGVGLAPVVVSAAHRKNGVGAALVREGLARCREAGFGWAVVLGEPAYYSRFGFQPAARHGLVDEYGGGEAFQVNELLPGAMPTNHGLVRYAPEFASLDE